MKLFFLFLCLFFITSGFIQRGFVLKGDIEGIENGEIYLIRAGNRRDTLAKGIISEGEFRLMGKIAKNTVALIRVKNAVNGPVIFLENKNFTLQLKMTDAFAPSQNGKYIPVKELENELLASISGGKDQQVANQFWQLFAEMTRKHKDLPVQYAKAEKEGNEKLLKELEMRNQEIQKTTLIQAKTILAENENSYVSAYIILEYLSDLCEDNPQEMAALYDLLGKKARESEYGKKLGTQIVGKKKYKISKVLPDFKLSTLDGTSMSLYGIKSKVKVLVFWSNGCAPCLREMPRLFKLYNEYRFKGVEFVVITTDNTPLYAEKLIRKLGLNWVNLGRFKATDTDVQKLYKIESIPYKIVLDEKNRILGKGHYTLHQLQELLNSTMKQQK